MKKTKWTVGIFGAALGIMVSAGTMTALADELAETPETATITETGDYSYLTGQQRSISRNELYAQAEAIEDEAEREAFLAENGIADTEYSEEAAASYSYVGGRLRGAAYQSSEDSDASEAADGYSYVTGQQRGASYRQ